MYNWTNYNCLVQGTLGDVLSIPPIGTTKYTYPALDEPLPPLASLLVYAPTLGPGCPREKHC